MGRRRRRRWWRSVRPCRFGIVDEQRLKALFLPQPETVGLLPARCEHPPPRAYTRSHFSST